MLFDVFIQGFVRYFVLLVHLDDELTTDEFQDLVDSERSPGSVHALRRNDLVDDLSVFHHFNLDAVKG